MAHKGQIKIQRRDQNVKITLPKNQPKRNREETINKR
jgi:hypothetical protein